MRRPSADLLIERNILRGGSPARRGKAARHALTRDPATAPLFFPHPDLHISQLGAGAAIAVGARASKLEGLLSHRAAREDLIRINVIHEGA